MIRWLRLYRTLSVVMGGATPLTSWVGPHPSKSSGATPLTSWVGPHPSQVGWGHTPHKLGGATPLQVRWGHTPHKLGGATPLTSPVGPHPSQVRWGHTPHKLGGATPLTSRVGPHPSQVGWGHTPPSPVGPHLHKSYSLPNKKMHPLVVATATKGPPDAMHVGVPNVSFFSCGWARACHLNPSPITGWTHSKFLELP